MQTDAFHVFDTTLRDGAQREGITYSVADKLAVARLLDDHAVVYAQHRGKRGHPVGFAPELYSELLALSGDEGARRLVARYPAFGVELDDPGILVDIDTEEDLVSARGGMSPEAPAVAGVRR